MDGRVTYDRLEEAVEALNTYAQQLDDPIDGFLKESQSIGEDGASAWGGTAAESVVPVLEKIKADIVQLQNAASEFSENVKVSMTNYANADAQNASAINRVVE